MKNKFSNLLPKNKKKYDERAIQQTMAPVLRKAAIDHLATSQDVVARNFRGEFVNCDMGHYKQFLNKQSRGGVWATYIEATALGELFGYNVVVTPIKDGVKQEPICLYRAENNAKTVHLYNSNNTHWYVDGRTLGDGNCLYNAFAQALYSHEQRKNSDPASLLDKQGIFSKQEQVINHQKAIEAAIQNTPTPKELQTELETHKQRIQALPKEQQVQIQKDYELALLLASEEMEKAGAPEAFSLSGCKSTAANLVDRVTSILA